MSGWNTDFKSEAPNTTKAPHADLVRTQADGRATLQTRIAAFLPDDEEAEPAREVLSLEDAAIRVAAMKGSPTLANSQAFAQRHGEQARALQAERLAALQSIQPAATVTVGEKPKAKPTRAEALSRLEAKLRRMPEDDRLAYVSQEKWSDEARRIVEEAYVNTMGTLPAAPEEDYFDDDPSEDFNAEDDAWADLTAAFRDEADEGDDE